MLGGLKTATPAGSGGASDHDNDSIDGMDGLDGKLEDHENKSPDGEGNEFRPHCSHIFCRSESTRNRQNKRSA